MKARTTSAPPGSAIERLIRPDLLELDTYQAAKPPETLAKEAGVPLKSIIKLNGNENPYGCPSEVRQALAQYSGYNIYPDPQQQRTRELLARYVKLEPEHILAGAGSDEVIDLLLRLTLRPGDQVIDLDPTFGMYRFSTQVCGGEVISVPRDDAFHMDLGAVKGAITPRTKIVFVCSPNNPSGNVTTQESIQELVSTDVLVVVDEAYYEFSGVTMAPLVPRYENLVVLRTLSKWAGLAGLRIGYGLMAQSLVEHLIAIKPPFNINAAAQVALEACMEMVPRLHKAVGDILEERESLYQQLSGLPGVKVFPSQANFLLCRFQSHDAQGVYEALARRGIFVRYFPHPRLNDCLRISVGKPEHTRALVEALGQILSQDTGKRK